MRPSKRRSSSSSKQVTVAKQEIFSGPLPKPETLAQYEQIKPGFAERLILMAEKEQKERHENQRALIQIEQQNQIATNQSIKRGQLLALVAVFAMIGYCSYLAFLGDIPASADAAKWIIIGLATVFITGRVASKIQKKGSDSVE